MRQSIERSQPFNPQTTTNFKKLEDWRRGKKSEEFREDVRARGRRRCRRRGCAGGGCEGGAPPWASRGGPSPTGAASVDGGRFRQVSAVLRPDNGGGGALGEGFQ